MPMRGQAGVTLLELLVTIAIVSMAVIIFAIGLLTSASVANQADQGQRLNLAMTAATETFRQAGFVDSSSIPTCSAAKDAAIYIDRYLYAPATTPGGTTSSIPRPATDTLNVEILAINYLKPITYPMSSTTSSATHPEPAWEGSCSNQAGAQRLTIKVCLSGTSWAAKPGTGTTTSTTSTTILARTTHVTSDFACEAYNYPGRSLISQMIVRKK